MRAAVLVVIVLGWLTGTAGAADRPAQRLAILVGNNIGLPAEVHLRYAETDAEKMAKVLVDLGGYAAADTLVLTGGSPAELRRALAGLRARVGPGSRLQVFFYYSGHGDGRHLHMAGERLPVAEVQAQLATLGAELRVLLVDSCQSGAITRAKGASAAPAYAVSMVADPEVAGSIVIASSSSDEVAQESDRLQGSFFTHYWVSGLYGPADADGDGLVTLDEAYRFAHFQTVDGTIDSRGGVQHPSYHLALTGQGTVVVAHLEQRTARLDIVSAGKGEYFVLEPDKKLVLTEVTGGSVRLPPGRYRIRKREAGRVLEHDVQLARGQTVTLRDADMRVADYAASGRKGADDNFLRVDRHGPVALAGVRSPLADEVTGALELTAGYQLAWGRLFVRPRGRILASELVTGERLWELDGGASVGLELSDRPTLRVGLDGGLVFFHRAEEPVVAQGQGQSVGGVVPLGAQGNGFVELGLPVAGRLHLVVYGRFGGELFTIGDQTRLAIVYGGGLGLTFLVD
jgi:hypothetical protein